MTHDPDNIHLPEMPLPPGLPPDDFPCCRQPTEPTYTASEVKVLTETATKVAYALGRKDALTEIADEMAVDHVTSGRGYAVVQISRETYDEIMASRVPQATSDATSGVPGHPEVSEAVRSPQEPPKLVCRRCFGYGLVTNHGMTTPCPDCALPRCPDCGLIDDHKGGCPQTGEAPQPGAPS